MAISEPCLPAPAPGKTDEHSRICVIGRAPTTLNRLNDLAGKISPAELRVVLAMAEEAERCGSNVIEASSRTLVDRTKCSRKHVQAALDSLTAAGWLTTRARRGPKPTTYQLNFLETTELTGFLRKPLAAKEHPAQPELTGFIRKPVEGFSTEIPTPTGFLKKPVAPVDSWELVDSGRIDPTPEKPTEASMTLAGILDRFSRATQKNTDRTEHAECTRFLRKYMDTRPGTQELRERALHGTPTADPPPKLVAEFLSIAPWPRLRTMLTTLWQEHKTCGSYPWFLTVAIQRIHGIAPADYRTKRDEIKLVKAKEREARAAPAGQSIGDQIATLAQTRRLK